MVQRSKQIFIITGHTGSGKTTFLQNLVETIMKEGYSVTGFLAPLSLSDSQNQSYEIQNIETRKCIPLASRKAISGWIKTGGFYFNPEAINAGNNILRIPAILNSDLIIVDEVGPFELDDKIWAHSISRLLSLPDITMILVVRIKLVQNVIEKWNLKITDIINIEFVTVTEASKMIISKLK
ncbi:MAG: hypothetical protein AMS27_15675 [Bacteroides sp. SM23_62_1]|nr:MAG: hypothetical protein AMS27_15675 [Bacteroides sp. SM23_62_1]